MTKRSKIVAILDVYNEESRLESCLKSFQWVDEIIIFVKESTDKTLEIALRLAHKVIPIPYSSASENVAERISDLDIDNTTWIIFPTASCVMHPALAQQILAIISSPTFFYDVIGIPYAQYYLGISNKRSPWYSARKNTLIKRSALKLSNELHREIDFYSGSKIYNIPFSSDTRVKLYHLSSASAEFYFDKQARYTKYESNFLLSGEKYSRKKIMLNVFSGFLRAFVVVIIKRKTYLLGWSGVALIFAYLSYHMMKFVHAWDASKSEDANEKYSRIRKEIDSLWDDNDYFI